MEDCKDDDGGPVYPMVPLQRKKYRVVEANCTGMCGREMVLKFDPNVDYRHFKCVTCQRLDPVIAALQAAHPDGAANLCFTMMLPAMEQLLRMPDPSFPSP